MKEIWKNIFGYEGYYQVSNFGNVRSVERRVLRSDGVIQTRKAKNKKPIVVKDGYLAVKLSKNGVDKRFYLHALVAHAFVEGYFAGAEVDHIDCNRANNRVDNLRWVTHADNIAHTITEGRHISQIRTMSGDMNPNYGNKALSIKYANNPELALEKQSRKGSVNGRAKSVRVILPDGNNITFDYISACARYLIDNNFVKGSSVNSISTYISKAATSGRAYSGLKFYF